MTLEELILSAAKLEPVPLAAYRVYHDNAETLISRVDRKLAARNDINYLIGNNPVETMFSNHRHHCLFMQTVFCLSDYSMLARTIAWVYRAYCAHGFKAEYFPVELNAWISAIQNLENQVPIQPVLNIYYWMLDNHQNFCSISENHVVDDHLIDKDWLQTKEAFKTSLLNGDRKNCLHIASESVVSSEKIEPFYLQVIQPSMYEIGSLWESAKISVAQEHLASAIVSIVMTAINLEEFKRQSSKGKAIVTSASNEFHEMGAWMIADLLNLDGWDVTYLGANTPVNDLITMVSQIKPEILGISITMPYNLVHAIEVINRLKSDSSAGKTKILVGGRCINDHPGISSSIGADAYAINASEALKITRSWYSARTANC